MRGGRDGPQDTFFAAQDSVPDAQRCTTPTRMRWRFLAGVFVCLFRIGSKLVVMGRLFRLDWVHAME